MSSFALHFLTISAIYGLMALGLNLQAGYAGLLNFGYIAFAGLGAYAAGIAANLGWSIPAGLALAVVVACVFAVLAASLGRGLASDYWGIATLALAEILRTVALNDTALTGGAQGIGGISGPFVRLGNAHADIAFLVLTVLCLGLGWYASNRLTSGRFGRALKVMREQPALATCFGYDLQVLKIQASVLSAIPAAIGGALLTYYTSFVGPDTMLAAETFLVWTMVMIGGIGNSFGVICGAFSVQFIYTAILFLKDALGIGSDIAGAIRLGVIGALLLICMIWRPAGLVPERIRQPRRRDGTVAPGVGG